MAKYKADLEDILFNLNKVLNVSQYEKYGLDDSSVQEILSENAKWVENEVFPCRQETDEIGVKMIDGQVVVPQCLHAPTRGYYEMGWYHLGVSEENGGTPVPEALAASCRSLGQGANTAWSMYVGLTRAAMNVIHMVGDDYLKNTYGTKMMEGAWGGTMCLTEAGAGSDVGNLKATAKPISGREGWYKIKGTKIFISGGDNDLYENIVHLVLARTPEGGPGTKGISLFVVPKYKVNSDGSLGESNDVNCTKFEHKMGIHGSATCVLNFGDADNCEGYLIGKEFDGMKNMFIMMNEARLDCGMQGESQAVLAYELTKQYVMERTQFRTEIINHPDVKKTMLKMRSMARGLRSLILYTADLFDKAHVDEKYHKYIGLLTPICKSFGSDQGFNICVEAVQMHGGYGYCTEYGIEQFVRDTKIASIYEGTNGIQALDFVMRKILADKGEALQAISQDIFNTSNALDEDFTFEKGIFSKAVAASQEAMGFIAKRAKNNQMNIVMQSCKDFLDLCSHIVVAWRLMESAMVAKKEIAAGAQNKEFLETKIVDFKIYCSQYLVQSISLAKSIVSVDEEMNQLPL